MLLIDAAFVAILNLTVCTLGFTMCEAVTGCLVLGSELMNRTSIRRPWALATMS